MQYLDLTLPTPEENLALDEAILMEAEALNDGRETLRFWESATPMVVVGRSSKVVVEVNCAACRRDGVPVLRRPSGGAAIVAGPGCLMYALVLDLKARPALRMLEHAHEAVLGTILEALQTWIPTAARCGTSDLAIEPAKAANGREKGVQVASKNRREGIPRSNDESAAENRGIRVRKFSGNSVRVRRDHLLYHGTLLYNFPLETVGEYLQTPPRQPEYRQGRPHADFVVNLPLDAATIRNAIRNAWRANAARNEWPQADAAQLVATRYGRPEWNEDGR
jgi:lipoate-protein ligase A